MILVLPHHKGCDSGSATMGVVIVVAPRHKNNDCCDSVEES